MMAIDHVKKFLNQYADWVNILFVLISLFGLILISGSLVINFLLGVIIFLWILFKGKMIRRITKDLTLPHILSSATLVFFLLYFNKGFFSPEHADALLLHLGLIGSGAYIVFITFLYACLAIFFFVLFLYLFATYDIVRQKFSTFCERYLKRFFHKPYAVSIYTILVFLGTLFWKHRAFTGSPSEHMMNYVLSTVLSIIIIYALFAYIRKVVISDSCYRDIFLLSIPVFLFLVLYFIKEVAIPEAYHLVSSDCLNIYNHAVTYDSFAYQFHYLTGYLYMTAMMLIPVEIAPIIFKFMLMPILFGYIVTRAKKSYQNDLGYLFYMLFLISPQLLYTHRLQFYSMLFMWFSAIIVFDYKDKVKPTIGKIILLCIMLAMLTQWRAEGFYYAMLGVIMLYVTYRRWETRKRFAVLLTVFCFAQLLIYIPQQIEQGRSLNTYTAQRLYPFYVYNVVNMTREGIDQAVYQDEYSQIDQVISVSAIEQINKDLGDDNYHDTYIDFMEGYVGVRPGYTQQEYDAFADATQTLIKENPDIFFKVKWRSWQEIAWSDTWLDTNTKWLYASLFITVVLFLFATIKKLWLNFWFSVGILVNWSIVFILSPASYFKYYYLVYFGGFMLLIIVGLDIYQYLSQPKTTRMSRKLR